MASACSFDIVSKIDLQEVKNAVEIAGKELRQRFDLKGSKSEICLEGDTEIIVRSADEFKLKAVIDILQSKLMKRGISLKSLVYEKMERALGGSVRQKIALQQGISADQAKAISKAIKVSKLKVQAQIQGEQLRVSGKSKDALQEVMQLLRSKDFGLDLQFTNYR